MDLLFMGVILKVDSIELLMGIGVNIFNMLILRFKPDIILYMKIISSFYRIKKFLYLISLTGT